KKAAEGKTPKEALRALKRKISDAPCKHLKADAARAAAGPGGQPGNGSSASPAGLHPERRLFGQATPGPVPTLRSRPAASKAACRAQQGQAPACPLFLPPGAVEAPVTAGGRRPSRAARCASTLETGGTAP